MSQALKTQQELLLADQQTREKIRERRNTVSQMLHCFEDVTNNFNSSTHLLEKTSDSAEKNEANDKYKGNRVTFDENRNKIQAFFREKSVSKCKNSEKSPKRDKSFAKKVTPTEGKTISPPSLPVLPPLPPLLPSNPRISGSSNNEKSKQLEQKMSVLLQYMQILSKTFIKPLLVSRYDISRSKQLQERLEQDYNKYLQKFEKAENDFLSAQEEYNSLI